MTIPSSVTSIGDWCFCNCGELKNLIIPSSVTYIGVYAFINCTGLTSLEIPSNATIDNHAFYGCTGLTSLEFPSNVTIGDGAFGKCTGLTNLTIPSSAKNIGAFPFHDCSGLKNVNYLINGTIESYLEEDHPYLYLDVDIKYYLNDKEITEPYIPLGVTAIGKNVFVGNAALTNLVIPSSVTSIGNYAFSACKNLNSLTIPSSVTDIKNGAFKDCSNLTSVYVNWTNFEDIDYSFGYDVFDGVDKSKCILYVPQGTKSYMQWWCSFENIVEYDPTGIDKVTISSDAKELSRYSLNGQRLSAPTKGLNIVKYSDGSVKKVAVQ